MKHLTSQGYYELTATIKRLERDLEMAKANYKKESKRADKECKRADLLQHELDNYDDFWSTVETEVSRSLSHRKPS